MKTYGLGKIIRIEKIGSKYRNLAHVSFTFVDEKNQEESESVDYAMKILYEYAIQATPPVVYVFKIDLDKGRSVTGDNEARIQYLRDLLIDKNCYFTVFSFNIDELLAGTKFSGNKSIINNYTGRNISKMHESYVGKTNLSEHDVFVEMQTKLLNGISDGIYDIDASE